MLFSFGCLLFSQCCSHVVSFSTFAGCNNSASANQSSCNGTVLFRNNASLLEVSGGGIVAPKFIVDNIDVVQRLEEEVAMRRSLEEQLSSLEDMVCIAYGNRQWCCRGSSTTTCSLHSHCAPLSCRCKYSPRQWRIAHRKMVRPPHPRLLGQQLKWQYRPRHTPQPMLRPRRPCIQQPRFARCQQIRLCWNCKTAPATSTLWCYSGT